MLNPLLHQYLTPDWAGEELVARFLPELPRGAVVIEPSCGDAAILKAFPDHVEAIGVEIDPALADLGRTRTHRRIVTGDFRTVDLPPAQAMLGNPPFALDIVDAFLERASGLLVPEGICGFVLPSYALQTPSRVLRWNETWSMQQWALPRTLFPGLSKPLVFVTFRKDQQRRLIGFFLYREAQDVAEMAQWVRQVLQRSESVSWRQVITEALKRLGGKAHVQQLYRLLTAARPTRNVWWKAKIRQELQRHFQQVTRGVWAL